jgi:hypothetical protein
MSVWSDNDNQVQVVQTTDPLSIIMGGIGDLKGLIADLKDTDIAYVKARIDKQWLAIDDLERRKADKTDMAELEKRVNSKAFDLFDKATDDVTRVRSLAETSDSAFDNLQERLNEIEKETARIGPMENSIRDLTEQIGNISALRWQIVGGATAIGFIFVTVDLTLRMFWHMAGFEELFHFHP